MMSASTRRFSMKIYTYYQVCILLVCLQHIQSESVSVSREGLREEHLLPVRMTRGISVAGFEGSGDDEAIPIQGLHSGMMERMTLKTDEEGNKIVDSGEVDEGKSKESIEATVEGSGFGDEKSGIVVNNTESSEEDEVTTTREEIITTVIPKVNVTEISLETTTMKEEETTISTTEKREVTTLPPETVTPDEETLPIVTTTESRIAETETTTMELTTILIGKEETTTTEKEPVTEVIEMKNVRPVMVEIPTKAPEEVKTEEIITTTQTTTTTIENETLLENVNLTAGTGTLLMKSDSRFLDTNEKVLENSKDPSKLGTYIVISLILLSFLSLIGFILMKRRVQKRRKKSIDPDTLDTEKALLSLSEYKDHPDGVDEGKIKNNEITPIVIKSNSQINKFEKNTNFSSPKNLNTKANEKNVEKENVLRKTSDNLTQVIIEDATKDVDEEKAQTNAEKLIVRTHLDQDSIPKKPVIVNRTSLGCVPVSQD